MYGRFENHLREALSAIDTAGLTKPERVIGTPQNAHIATIGGPEVLNLCANNYLGLADHPALIASAHAALERWGYVMASVRFICGTLELSPIMTHRFGWQEFEKGFGNLVLNWSTI